MRRAYGNEFMVFSPSACRCQAQLFLVMVPIGEQKSRPL